MTSKVTVALLTVLITMLPALAQESPNYRVSEHNLNSAGTSEGSSVLASPNFLITLGAIGDPLARVGMLESPNYRTAAGFASGYAPPAEVHGILLVNSSTLVWDPAPGAISYSLYRGAISGLSTASYGSCKLEGLVSASAVDPDSPPTGDGFFYLAAARNTLEEEGITGHDSSSALRTPTSCP